MIQMDYSTYLDEQNRWAKSLIKQAQAVSGRRARELAELAGSVLRRTLSISDLQRQINRQLAGLTRPPPSTR